MDLFGLDYLADHIIATRSIEVKELAYQVYMSDCTRLYVNALYRETAVKERFIDLVAQAQPDRRTPEELKRDLLDTINEGRV